MKRISDLIITENQNKVKCSLLSGLTYPKIRERRCFPTKAFITNLRNTINKNRKRWE